MGVQPEAAAQPLWRRPAAWLVVVAVLHAVSPLIVLGAHWAFGPDETIYLSQLNAYTKAEYFSAPRARGSTLIAAPITLLTSSVEAVRLWVSALSGLGLWLAFRPWLRVVRGWIVPMAAAAFASLWMVILYGFQVMPNEWVAFGTLGAAGALLRYFADRRRRHLIGVAVALAIVGLLRPSDAVYAVAGLGVSLLFLRETWRARLMAAAAMLVGLVAGVTEWVIEAETSFGGIAARVHQAQAEQSGSGLHWGGAAELRVLAGPLLCRGTCTASAPTVYRLWWPALGALVVVAVLGAMRRHTDRRMVLLPVVTGVVVAAQYLLTVGYGAPRFLIPAYAMLAIPAMLGARDVVTWMRRPRLRVAATGVLVTALVLSAVVQVHVLTGKLKPFVDLAAAHLALQADALTDDGVHGNCDVLGLTSSTLQLTYALDCTDFGMTSAQIHAAMARRRTLIWLRPKDPGRHFGGVWQHVWLPHAQHSAWVFPARGPSRYPTTHTTEVLRRAPARPDREQIR